MLMLRPELNLPLLLSTLLQSLTSLPKIIDPDDKTIKIVARNGYPCEKHTVQTSDGYMLGVYRIPNPGKPVVFLMHGLLSSSADWVIIGKDKALGFMLYDAGFDVWLGNARGNMHSREHINISPSDPAFWNFSWHEIGVIDVPAMIDYILSLTLQRSLHYAGYSQGTTSFFVMLSERPEYNAKIRCMHALAPIAFMEHNKNMILRLAIGRMSELENLASSLGIWEIMPNNPLLVSLSKMICSTTEENGEGLCPYMMYLVAGYNPAEMNASSIPEIMESFPAGASVKQLLHYTQEILSGRFCQYDYGEMVNLAKYGQKEPPHYVISRVICPVILHYSDNDLLSHPADVKQLAKGLGSKPTMMLIKDPMFSHVDYIWGKHVDELIYQKIIRIMKKF